MALFIGEMGLGHDARLIEDGKLKRIGRDNGALGRRCTNRLGNSALRESELLWPVCPSKHQQHDTACHRRCRNGQ